MKSIRTLIAAAALCVAGAAPAFAQSTTFTNGDFSAGLSGWDTLGDVSVSNAGRAVLTTAYLDGDFVEGDELFNLSGSSAAWVDEVESFAGLTSGVLGSDATEGSVLLQSFTVSAGDSISLEFWFGLATQETNAADYNDFAFVAVNGEVQQVVSLTDASRSGQFSFQFLTGGTAELAFGVVDVGDTAGVSYFIVDNVNVTAVPEPSSYAMLLAGMAIMGSVAARRRRQG